MEEHKPHYCVEHKREIHNQYRLHSPKETRELQEYSKRLLNLDGKKQCLKTKFSCKNIGRRACRTKNYDSRRNESIKGP
jgi:hypothetical protein